MKRKTTYYFFVSVFLLLAVMLSGVKASFSQTVTATFTGSAGKSNTIGGMYISYSVGEPAVSTFTASGTPPIKYLTQGAQQPFSTCPASATITANPSAPVCPGTSVTLTAVPFAGIGPFTYSWSTGQTTTASNIVVVPSATSGYTFNIAGCAITGIITHTVNVKPGVPKPTVGVLPGNPICAGKTLGLNTGPNGLAYSWTGPNNFTSTQQNPLIPNVQTAASGTYSVVETNAGGCSSAPGTASVSVNSSPSPLINGFASLTVTICSGSSILLAETSGSAGVYNWNTGSTTSAITVAPITPKPFSVIVKNSFGCSDTAFAFVDVAPTPTISINTGGTNSICSGSSISLTAVTNGGSVPFTYFWSTGDTTNTDTITDSPTAPTNYTVIVEDGKGCRDTASRAVAVFPAPVISVSGNSTVCQGSAVTLSASGAASYSWNTGVNTSSIIVSPTSITDYTVTGTGAGGCKGVATFSVNVSPTPTVTISGNLNICAGDSTPLTANVSSPGPNNFLWNPGGLTNPIINVSPTIQTQYVVTVTNGAGCKDTANATVNVSPAPVPVISTTTTTLCVAQTATLTASGGGTYLWSTIPAQTTSVISVTPFTPGLHTFSVTAFNGNCSANTAVTLNVKQLPSITASISDPLICPGDPVTLIASGGIGYAWANIGVGDTVIIIPSVATTYTVLGLGLNGCYNIATTAVAFSTITADAGPDLTICPGFSVPLNVTVTGNVTPIMTYVWSPGIYLNDSMVKNPTATPDSSAAFIVEVRNQDGCKAKDSVNVSVKFSPGCVIHIYNGITPNGDGDNDVWWIDGIRFFPDNQISIFNRWGTEVWSASHYDNKEIVWKGTDDRGVPLPGGTYYYVVKFKLNDGRVQTISEWVELTR